NVVLARIYEAKGDLATATLNYRRAIDNQPEMIELHSALAKIYARLKDYNRALESLNKARELSNSDPQYLRRIAETLDLAGRHGEAETVRRQLPAEPVKPQSTAEQFAEAARMRSANRAKAVATYRQAFNAFAADL